MIFICENLYFIQQSLFLNHIKISQKSTDQTWKVLCRLPVVIVTVLANWKSVSESVLDCVSVHSLGCVQWMLFYVSISYYVWLCCCYCGWARDSSKWYKRHCEVQVCVCVSKLNSFLCVSVGQRSSSPSSMCGLVVAFFTQILLSGKQDLQEKHSLPGCYARKTHSD